MMIQCIGRPAVDTPSLVKSVEAATKESLTSRFTGTRHKFGDVTSLLAVLSMMQNRSADPVKSVRACGSLLAHVQYVFAVALECDTLQDLLERNDLKITVCSQVNGNLQLVVVSGTLKEFKDTAIECCVKHQPEGLRRLMTEFIRFFIGEGLGDLFHDLDKTPVPDGTLYLSRK